MDQLRIFEHHDNEAVDLRTDSLQHLRELGPPDLVQLVKQPIKSTAKAVSVFHHVTGQDASSSASLAAYINTLVYSPHDKLNKVVSGLYWYVQVMRLQKRTCYSNLLFIHVGTNATTDRCFILHTAATMPSPDSTCASKCRFLEQ